MSVWILVPLLVFCGLVVSVSLAAHIIRGNAGEDPVYSVPSSSLSRESILRDLYVEDVLTLEQYERALNALGPSRLYPDKWGRPVTANLPYPARPGPTVDETREDRTVVEIEIRIPR